MIRAPSFRWVPVRTVAEAARALADEPGAMLLAGGTDLVPNMKRRQQVPSALVSLRRVAELRGTRIDAGGALVLGAATTLADVAAHPAIAGGWRALQRAAAQVATPHLRNMGTIGGNLCIDTRCNYYDQTLEWRKAIDYCMKAPGPSGVARETPAGGICWVAPSSPKCKAVSSTDGAPALVALGARVVLASVGGERDIALEDLYADDGMAHLTKRRDEILTEIRVPPLRGWRSTYWKLRRRSAFDFPVLGVAAAVRFGTGGIVEDARVVLGGVASRPVLVSGTRELVGRPLTDDAIAAFEHAAGRLAKPLDNTDFDLHWRKKVARVFLRGVLCELRGDDPAALGLLARRAATGIVVLP